MWRDHLLKEEVALNAKLLVLDNEEKEGDDKRVAEEKEEASSKLAEVHARLTDIDAETGPSRAAALLAGRFSMIKGGNAMLITCLLAIRPRF